MTNFELDMRAVEKAASAAIENLGAKFQRLLDRLHETHAGEPVADVEVALSTACTGIGLSPEAEQLRSWAQAISDGKGIAVAVAEVRLEP